ncbi:methyl-accepting chemotaxis protein [Clostridium aminobutyricum]|uniref:Methyl-accepting chemotaxis protein n=1 Tax=Clostridium aminobutyricum TaxID=33953 RepID=A0A939D7D0_CLOAM|nr:methyl-accepting chemotaxis protein [Clostridium aminobutyricum]MBN7772869.1 methyl-accepting chemotaxis protein [Clostridium aminobutyricum]
MSFRSIKTKILVVVLAVLLLSLGTVSAVFGILSIKGTESTVRAILEETSKTAALAMQNRMNVSKNILNEIGTNILFTDMNATYEEKRQILDSKAEKYKAVRFSVVNFSGVDLEGKYVGDKEFFKKSLDGETFYSSPELKEDGSGTMMYVSAPLWDKGVFNSRVVGVVYVILDGQFLSDITGTISVGETGDSYIIDKNSTFLAHQDESLVNSASNIINMSKSDSTLSDLAGLAEQAMKGKACFGEYIFQGADKLAAFCPIEGTDGWSICVNVEKSEFMKYSYEALAVCVGIALAALLAAAFIMMVLAGKITKPIREVEAAAKELAEGNFDYEITYSSQDEIGNLADSMRTMIMRTKDVITDTSRALDEMSKGNFDLNSTAEYVGIFKQIETSMMNIVLKLSQTLHTIKTSADQVDIGAEQVSTGSQALAQGAIEQASSIEELAAAVNQIAEKVKANAEHAITANKKTTRVGEDLQQSNEQMNHMMTAMEDISNKSKEISKIIKSIEDIAFQTNILALNAAVEAARAGTAGKGFAVVADEVRNLAGKSAEAAKNTTMLIEETVRAVSEGSLIAEQTAIAIKSVVENAGDVITVIDDISNAFKEQADSINQITIGLDQVSSVVQSNSATAEESAAASEELSGQASTLKEEVNRFTLKNREYF